MKAPVIYKIRNVVNDKFYVGSTGDTRERFRVHRQRLRRGVHHCKHLQASWNKYGEDCFKFEVVERVEFVEKLWEAEEVWLSENFGKPWCYNAGRSPDAPMRGRFGKLHPSYGKVMPDEQKQLLSKATKKQWETRDPRTNTKHTEEAKLKISQKVQAALAEGRGGKFIPSEETRLKMSEALKGNQCAKGYKRTQEEIEAIRQRTLGNQNWLGKTHAEESKDKMRRKIIAVSPEGVETEHGGVKLTAEYFSIDIPLVINACKNKNQIKKGKLAGWTFMYESDRKPLYSNFRSFFPEMALSRKECVETGKKYYFTGEFCVNGHRNFRKAKGSCVACEGPSRVANEMNTIGYVGRFPGSLVEVVSGAEPVNRGDFPSKLSIVTFGKLLVIETDVYYITEDVETCIEWLVRHGCDSWDALFWREARKAFPTKTCSALRKLHAEYAALALG